MDNLFSLAGKTALITGAAQGNGKVFAEALFSAGADVILLDICDLNETEKSLKKYLNLFSFNRKIQKVYFNLEKSKDLKLFPKNSWWGTSKIDILVNNAGISEANNWEKTFRINVDAVNDLINFFSQNMISGSSIINITSLNSELAFPENPAYVSSKGALKMLTKAWALDLAPKGIRCNNLQLGYFHTGMTDKSYNDPQLYKQRSDRTMLNRWGEEKDLWGPIIFLASGASSYITGADIVVDGGWSARGL